MLVLIQSRLHRILVGSSASSLACWQRKTAGCVLSWSWVAVELGASGLAAGCGAVVELGVGPLWSWVWGRWGAGCGAVVELGVVSMELGVGLLWSWVRGCCGAGCGFHGAGCELLWSWVRGCCGAGCGFHRAGCGLLWSWVWGCCGAGCGFHRAGCGLLWSWVWGCCGAGCGKHSAVGCPCHRETLSIFFGRVTGNAISYWSPLCLSYLEISLVISERGRREAEQVECLCTMSNTKTAVTRKCPHRSANTSLAMMVVETDRWWWMTVVMSLVQLPWFTPCPENT